jgi:hypothetical protein
MTKTPQVLTIIDDVGATKEVSVEDAEKFLSELSMRVKDGTVEVLVNGPYDHIPEFLKKLRS